MLMPPVQATNGVCPGPELGPTAGRAGNRASTATGMAQPEPQRFVRPALGLNKNPDAREFGAPPTEDERARTQARAHLGKHLSRLGRQAA
jgi:hypothetical protein